MVKRIKNYDEMVVGLQFLVEKFRKGFTKNNFLAKLEGSTLWIRLSSNGLAY